jgi:hypothetical protein
MEDRSRKQVSQHSLQARVVASFAVDFHMVQHAAERRWTWRLVGLDRPAEVAFAAWSLCGVI